MWGASSALMPGPVSRTRITIDDSSMRSRALSTLTVPPDGVCFTAFARRFVRTRTMRPSSTNTFTSWGSPLSSRMPLASASGATCATLRSPSSESAIAGRFPQLVLQALGEDGTPYASRELDRLERLREVVDTADLEPLAQVLVAVLRGHEDDRDVRRLRL